MNCLICNRDTGDHGRDRAISIHTAGNYGSRVLDSDDPGTVHFSVCDACLIERRDRCRLAVKERCAHCGGEPQLYTDEPLPDDAFRA